MSKCRKVLMSVIKIMDFVEVLLKMKASQQLTKHLHVCSRVFFIYHFTGTVLIVHSKYMVQCLK